MLWHEAGGFQRGALSFLPSASPLSGAACASPDTLKLSISLALLTPGSASSAGGAFLAPLNPTGKIPCGITGLAGQEQPGRRQPLSFLAFLRPHPGVVLKLSSDVAYFFIHGMRYK